MKALDKMEFAYGSDIESFNYISRFAMYASSGIELTEETLEFIIEAAKEISADIHWSIYSYPVKEYNGPKIVPQRKR